MLYYLLYHVLQRYFSPLNVFRYITVRTVYASLTAMFLALVFGPWLIRKLRELQIGQYIREEGPQEHKKKAGTPTMGGVLIVLSTAVPVLLWADLTNAFVLIALFALLGIRRDRFHGRLRKGFEAKKSRPHRQAQVLPADSRQPCRRGFAARSRNVQRLLDAACSSILQAHASGPGHSFAD